MSARVRLLECPLSLSLDLSVLVCVRGLWWAYELVSIEEFPAAGSKSAQKLGPRPSVIFMVLFMRSFFSLRSFCLLAVMCCGFGFVLKVFSASWFQGIGGRPVFSERVEVPDRGCVCVSGQSFPGGGQKRAPGCKSENPFNS